MTDFLRNSLQDRELQRLRHEREAEDEVEDVRLRQQAGEGSPLGRLAAGEAAGAVERDVGLGVEGVALEHDEPRVDAAAPERLGGRPRHAGRVDRAEDDPQRAVVAVAASWPASSPVRRRAPLTVVAGGRASSPLWSNRLTPGAIPARTRDTCRGTVPVPVPWVGGGLGWSDRQRHADAHALRRPTRAGRSSAAPSARA